MKSPAKRDPESPGINTDLVFSILGNPSKRKIIMFLGERGKASFSDLKKELRMSVGNLYYNIDNLTDFIERDEDKKYLLTERGRQLYAILTEEQKRIDSILRPKGRLYRALRRFVGLFIPLPLILFFYRKPSLSIAVSLIIMLCTGMVLVITGSDMLLLEIRQFYTFSDTVNLGFLSVPSSMFLMSKPLLNWLVLCIILELESAVLGHRERRIEFYFTIPLSFVPLLFYPILLSTTGGLPSLGLLGTLFLSVFYRLVLQVFALGLLMSILTIFKGFNIERSFVLVFIVYHLSFMLSILLGRIS